jgi:hypothetical protein
VRDLGASRLIGALPAEAGTVELPASKAVRYDLLRGGTAKQTMQVSAENPLLLVERATRIAQLEITPDLNLRLTDENGAAVDRSVVHVEVLDPSGRLVRHYGSNYTIRDGNAQIEVPFATNDQSGSWRLRARDVISGLTAERVITR